MEFTSAPLEPFGSELLNMTVQSKLSLKTPLVYRVVKLLQRTGCLPSIGTHIAELCFEEAIVNAMMHGNRLEESKKVAVTVFANHEKWGMIIEDEGEGFRPEDVPPPPDPNNPETIFRTRGRGITLMDAYLDELRYDRRGRKLLMVRRRQAEPEPHVLKQIEEERKRTAAFADKSSPSPNTGEFKMIDLPDDIELDLAEETHSPLVGEGFLVLSEIDGVRVVRIQMERLMEDTIELVQPELYKAVEGQIAIVLDLEPVEFIASVGLAAFMTVFKRVAQAKGKVVFVNARPAVVDIFNLCRLTTVISLQPDLRTAVAAVKY